MKKKKISFEFMIGFTMGWLGEDITKQFMTSEDYAKLQEITQPLKKAIKKILEKEAQP